MTTNEVTLYSPDNTNLCTHYEIYINDYSNHWDSTPGAIPPKKLYIEVKDSVLDNKRGTCLFFREESSLHVEYVIGKKCNKCNEVIFTKELVKELDTLFRRFSNETVKSYLQFFNFYEKRTRY